MLYTGRKYSILVLVDRGCILVMNEIDTFGCILASWKTNIYEHDELCACEMNLVSS